MKIFLSFTYFNKKKLIHKLIHKPSVKVKFGIYCFEKAKEVAKCVGCTPLVRVGSEVQFFSAAPTKLYLKSY